MQDKSKRAIADEAAAAATGRLGLHGTGNDDDVIFPAGGDGATRWWWWWWC